jgi:hypothetical protein
MKKYNDSYEWQISGENWRGNNVSFYPKEERKIENDVILKQSTSHLMNQKLIKCIMRLFYLKNVNHIFFLLEYFRPFEKRQWKKLS